ncbi:MAG: F0F1 ATP synthase subunit B [Patescibacteria group bacterium]
MTEPIHAAAEAAQAVEASGGIGALGINAKLLLAQLVNFSVLLFVMWKWVYTPLLKTMDARAKKIQDGLDFAKQASLQLKEIDEEHRRMLREAKAEAHALIEDAALKAEAVRKSKTTETASEIEKMLADAKTRMAQERDATFEVLRNDIAQFVTLATKKVVEGMDEKQRSSLVTKAIGDVGNT